MMRKIFCILFVLATSQSFSQITLPDYAAQVLNSGAPTTSSTMSAGAGVSVGNFIIIAVACENLTGGADGNNSDVSNVTDNLGNTYTAAGQYSNNQGGAGNGATISLWYCKRVEFAGNPTITVTLNGSARMVVGKYKGQMPAGHELRFSSQSFRADDGTADPGSLSLTGLTSREYVFFRFSSVEWYNDGATVTETSGWDGTIFEYWGTSNLTAPQEDFNIGIAAESKIATTTSATSDFAIARVDMLTVTNVECSSGLYAFYTAPTPSYFGSASTPVDGGAGEGSPVAVTPVTSMAAGDLVLIYAYRRGAATTIEISQTGGQNWTSETIHGSTTATLAGRVFWCTFNGTWSANPSVSFSSSSTTNTNVVMHVFRPSASSSTWALGSATVGADAENVLSSFASAATITNPSSTFTPDQNRTVTLAIYSTDDDNTWGTPTGTGWKRITSPSAQFRNTTGSDVSSAYMYYLQSESNNIPAASLSEATLGNDPGIRGFYLFYEVPAVSATRRITVIY